MSVFKKNSNIICNWSLSIVTPSRKNRRRTNQNILTTELNYKQCRCWTRVTTPLCYNSFTSGIKTATAIQQQGHCPSFSGRRFPFLAFFTSKFCPFYKQLDIMFVYYLVTLNLGHLWHLINAVFHSSHVFCFPSYLKSSTKPFIFSLTCTKHKILCGHTCRIIWYVISPFPLLSQSTSSVSSCDVSKPIVTFRPS